MRHIRKESSAARHSCCMPEHRPPLQRNQNTKTGLNIFTGLQGKLTVTQSNTAEILAVLDYEWKKSFL